jgi:hypothetical protein
LGEESSEESPESRHSSKQAAAAAGWQQDRGGQITKTLSPKFLHKYQTSKANRDQVFGGLEKLTKLVQCLLSSSWK